MKQMAERLERLAHTSPVWTEIRYHRRRNQSLQVQKGLVKGLRSNLTSGAGIRVLVDGAWGFSSCSDTSLASLERALKQAIACAKSLQGAKKAVVPKLPSIRLARGDYSLPGYEALEKMSLEEKLSSAIRAEEAVRKSSPHIHSANCVYNEIFEDKVVVTSDGAKASSQVVRGEFRLSAVASKDGEKAEGHRLVGKTGAWECLFAGATMEGLSEEASRLAIELLRAPRVPGGTSTLILAPAMVGLLSHEAIGHTVEADFVLSGSVAAGKIGTQVASPLVTLCDSGFVESAPEGGGNLLVDDEGVPTQKTVIIDKGKLASYLHNRESAALYKVQPTGNARAWLYADEPLIRMRNTYIEAGTEDLEAMIARTENGYLLDGPLGGQADATGEFMFGAQKVTKIENGQLTKLYRGATISGQAFNVLASVDGVSKEFRLDLGAGYCGKGQPAKVDAGGPYIRCQAAIAGVQG